MVDNRRANRLVEIDALRGLAALAVVLFHLTTRFTQLYNPNPPPTISFPDGSYGVNLFFIISGFVIFMTLEKTTRPMDFVVSRFSRLFPAFWVAIITTFIVTHWLGLPGKLVDLTTAFGNLIMIHSFFRIPHVDGVYWTLEIELLFYVGMFLLYKLQRLNQVHYVIFGLLALRLTYFGLEKWFGIELSWTISRFLILGYIPWFSLGISIYLLTNRHESKALWQPVLTIIFAILTLLIVDSFFVFSLAVVLGAAVFLAANGRIPLLQHRILVWLGTISYPLYLLHENIGWSLQLRFVEIGIPLDMTVLMAMASVFVLASAMSFWVEQPAMRWIRRNYRNRRNFVQ